MLVISRKLGEVLQIGDSVKVTVVEIQGSKIRLGFDADRSTVIMREEAQRNDCKKNLADLKLA